MRSSVTGNLSVCFMSLLPEEEVITLWEGLLGWKTLKINHEMKSLGSSRLVGSRIPLDRCGAK